MERIRINISGTVQGVGFRPSIKKLARTNRLTGFIYNDTNGVTIEVQGKKEMTDSFIDSLEKTKNLPPAAKIQKITRQNIPSLKKENAFKIIKSKSNGDPTSEVPPDLATCEDCLRELFDKQDFRYNYPFINCTNCGPRYSIVKKIPYDRCNTTMNNFKMCPHCEKHYKDINDRRFHAQPVACHDDGPSILLIDNNNKNIAANVGEVISVTREKLLKGKIIALKGIGGFHLVVNALDNEAVKRLRKRKYREQKPFAMMAPEIKKIKKFAKVNETAENILRSPQAPIVLLPKKQNTDIADSVAPGVDTFGFMLCYAPLHHMIFKEKIEALVMTSGNFSDEPLIADNKKAFNKLSGIADYFLMHNRPIYRQIDDSVIHIINKKAVPLRRARGYVPEPVFINKKAKKHILALGSDLKNTFCFAKNNKLVCSEHIGDLENAEAHKHFINSIKHMGKLFEIKPEVLVCDLHPNYFSSKYAAGKKLKTIKVQHHWAHVASVMAENNIYKPVIGIECDGTGYGKDGKIWGCEVLLATPTDFERFAHLEYFALPGADKASKEPIRPLMGLLKNTFKDTFSINDYFEILRKIEPDEQKLKILGKQLDKNFNCIKTSSLGRIFDAVSALAGLGNYNNFDAQLPMALEACINKNINEKYPYELKKKNGKQQIISLRKTIEQLLKDALKTDPEVISTKFHNTMISALKDTALIAREKNNINKVALSGGVFCNKYLIQGLTAELKREKFEVFQNIKVPSNDGGLSLGQAFIAVNMLNNQENTL